MSETAPDEFREAARKITRLLIDGADVSLDEVLVDVAATVASPTSRFEMEISSIALHHELREAGVVITLGELATFVQKDLVDHPQEALSGYLGIIRGILGVEPPKRRWRLFAKPEPAAAVKWSIVRVESVVQDEERLAIRGLAKRT